jgi:hypothetical protein
MKVDRIGRYVARQGGKFVCTGFWLENVKERDRLKDLVMDGKTILNWTFKQARRIWKGFIQLRIRRDLVSAVMNLRFPKNLEDFLTS